jgi:hypothetical protein
MIEMLGRVVMDNVFSSRKLNRLWYFLNSSLFLWFMTSVVLAVATLCYGKWSETRAAEHAKITRILNLKTEITYRLDEDIMDIIFQDSESDQTISIDMANNICNMSRPQFSQTAFRPLGGPSMDDKLRMLTDRFVYGEFKDRSIYSLLWELKSLDSAGSVRIQEAISSLSELRKAAYSGKTAAPIRSYFENVRALVRSWDLIQSA